MYYILSIDQGTSSTRAIVYETTQFSIVARHQIPLPLSYPNPGFVEQDPEIIWAHTKRVIEEVLRFVPAHQIIACGITNQRETTILWDSETGEALTPAVVWQDRRSLALCQNKAITHEALQHKTGLRLDPYFCASKIEWLLLHYPKAKARAQKNKLCFGTIDSFLLWRLTKGAVHATDVTNASRTLLFNIHTHQWDPSLLELFQIPAQILPQIHSSDSTFGVIDPSLFGVAIPITGIAGDQQAALIGQGCITNAACKSTFGSGGFLMMNTGEEAVFSKHHLLTTIAYQVKNQTAYALEGSIYQAGTLVKWLIESLGLISIPSDTESLAESLESNDGVYLIPSFTGLGAPYWSTQQGGALTGLTRATTKAHVARAALEATCYQARAVLECMIEDSRLKPNVLKVDGGMTENQWFLHFLSTQCSLALQKPRDIELTAKGAALLAAIGCGHFSSLDEVNAYCETEQHILPNPLRFNRQKDFNGWQSALQTVLT